MNGMKKHIDTVIVLGGILASVLWMNHQFSGVDNRFAQIDKDLAVIKTVLVLKGIMPPELVVMEEIK